MSVSQHDRALMREAHSRHLVVAIDGPAGAGKSTVGRNLAAALDCPYIDTGLMYRAITWLALQRGLPLTDGDVLGHLASSVAFHIDPATHSLFVDGAPPDSMLRSPQVDASVSTASAHPAVRQVMVARQRSLAEGRCIVMVGRDISTVVLPGAPVKLWVTASAAERARRRLAEQLPGSEGVSEEEAVRQIEARDRADSSRAVSPLSRAPGSVDIDTGNLTPEEALRLALRAVSDALDRMASLAGSDGR